VTADRRQHNDTAVKVCLYVEDTNVTDIWPSTEHCLETILVSRRDTKTRTLRRLAEVNRIWRPRHVSRLSNTGILRQWYFSWPSTAP